MTLAPLIVPGNTLGYPSINTVRWRSGVTQASASFSAIGAEETLWRNFDFSPALAVGETLTGTPGCAVIVLSGTDATPSARVLIGPTITGTIVSVRLGTMLAGVVYQLLITVATSASQALGLAAVQNCTIV